MAIPTDLISRMIAVSNDGIISLVGYLLGAKIFATEPIMSDDDVLRLIQKRVASQTRVPFQLQLLDGRSYSFGEGEPAFQLIVKERRGLAALRKLELRQIGEAYMNGALDIKGDMLQVLEIRRFLTDQNPWWHRLWRHLEPMVLSQIRTDQRAIAQHYEFDDELYLSYLGETRCYSHAIFEQDDEPLDMAQRRKLDFAIEACRMTSGQHVLDVGGGWGTFTEHAGRRNIRVTSLTISQKSVRFLTDLINQLNLPCQALKQNFLEYDSADLYDAIVILGVIEHLPNYSAVLQRCQRLLKPGGRIYLDAAATRVKYRKDSFVSRYIFPGNHSFLCLHDFLSVVANTPFELLAVYNDRRNYYLTGKAWAENFERAKDQIISRWGKKFYRMMRLYLWGTAEAFASSDGLDAYRVILELPETASY